MYMKLLEQTVKELKGEEFEDDARATVNLRVDLRIDPEYVPDMNQRLMLYRKVAAARQTEEIERVLEEAEDRYGSPPDSVLNLADYGRIRIMADRLGVESIDRDGRSVVIKFRPQTNLEPARLVALVHQRPELTLVPPAALRMDLDRAPRGERPAGPPKETSAKPDKSGRSRGVSWWTTRARAGEVAPGFSKEEILRPAPEDPRAPGGILRQAGALLSDILDQG